MTRALLALALLGGCTARYASPEGASTRAHAPQPLQRGYGQTSLRFEPNRGQFADPIRFAARTGGLTALFTDAGARLRLQSGDKLAEVGVTLVAAHSRRPVAEGPLPTRTNYLVGDRAHWASGVPNFARLRYAGVRPGVDLLFHGKDGRVEYDLEAAPGVPPAELQIRFDGAERLSVGPGGSLRIEVGDRALEQPAPVAYDEDAGGVHHPLVARYRVLAADRVGFAVAGHDPRRRLVIDPVIVYSSFLGGDGDDRVNRILADGTGALYLVGFTSSTNFPHPGGYDSTLGGGANGDAFVAKINAAGSAIEWATYLGGSLYDEALGLWLDGGNKVWVTGTTGSSDFPTQNPYQATSNIDFVNQNNSTGFVVRLSANGATLEYGTYFGSITDCCDYSIAARDVFVNAAGQMYLVGSVNDAQAGGASVPIQSGYQLVGQGATDMFVTRFSASGTSLISSTYLGGNGDDYVLRMRVDPGTGNVMLAGFTTSSNYPTMGAPAAHGPLGASDSFATVLSADGTQLVRSARIGGTSNDTAGDAVIAPTGAVYWAGYTQSNDYPIVGGVQSTRRGGAYEGFVTMLNPAGDAISFSTYYGGIDLDVINGIAVNALGEIFAVGHTLSSNLVLVNPIPVYGNQIQGGTDGFAIKLSADGSTLLSSTYLGGTGNDEIDRVAVDGSGIYIAGATVSVDLPTYMPFQASFAGGAHDLFVAKQINSALITPVGAAVPRGGTVSFSASNGSGSYTWSMQANPSGGSISGSGFYTAGSTGGVTDVIKLTDNGNSAVSTASVVVYQCTSDNDCAAGQYCASVYTCQVSRPGGSGCNASIDCAVPTSCALCAAPNICATGTCRTPACSSDGDCPAGSYCGADSVCHMQRLGGSSCNTAAGADCKVAGCGVCTTPGTCASGTCTCVTDPQCPSGHVCQSGACVLGGTDMATAGADLAGTGGPPDLAVPPASEAPMLDGAFNGNASVGKAYAFNTTNQLTLTGNVAAQRPVTFGKDSGPDNFYVDQTTGSISWIPRSDQQGAQTIAVHATNAVGTAPLQFTVTVGTTSLPPPSAQISADRSLGKVPFQVVFSSTSTAGAGATLISQLIDFGDGSSPRPLSASSLSYIYRLVGSFRPELRVSQSDGQTSLSKTTIVVQDLNGVTPPQVHATATVSPSDPNTLIFDGGFTAGSEPIVGYAWDFGDGTRTGEEKPTHKFEKSGSYLVTVQAYDDLGYYGADKVLVLLNISGTAASPSVRLAADPPGGDVGGNGLVVTLTATPENLDSAVASYAWDFGDSGTMTTDGGQIDHVYGSPGIFVARVTMTTQNGVVATAQLTIAVTSGGHLPASIVSIGSPTARVGVPYVYSDSGVAAARGDRPLTWALGGGSPPSAQINPNSGHISWTPTAAEVGKQRLVLRASNAYGAPATSVVAVEVTGGKGCGCTLAPAPPPIGPLGLFGLFLFGLVRRRRR